MKRFIQIIIARMQKNAGTAWGLLRMVCATVMVLGLFVSFSPQAQALVFNFQDDIFHEIPSEGLLINSDDGGDEDATLQFGNDASDGLIVWDDGLSILTTSDLFRFSDTEDTELIRFNDTTNADSTSIYTGTGTPNGALSAESGSLFLDQAGGLFVNTSAGAGTVWSGLASDLDAAYNGFGASAAVVDIDAAESQTGGLEFLVNVTDNFTIDLESTGDFVIQDNNTTFATFTDSGDLDLTNNFTVGASAETISNGSFTLDGDDVFVADSLGVEGAIYSDTFSEKNFFFDIGGGIRSSAALGSVAGGNAAVIRFDDTTNSRVRWSFPVPDDADTSSDITVDVFWSPAVAGNGAEQIEYMWRYAAYSPTDVIAASDFTGNETQTQVTVPTTLLEVVETSFTISSADFTADEFILVRLSREDPSANADDDFADEISVHSVRVRYQGKAIQ